ncbi:hypothetical protein BpHYR1_034125 [Brachionus plicatilis]|uniref:Uncharacterized protein n=1 Tax=Brachionus plicatilis TaxID=10195 RepID=A0A3M7SAZ7_BRAPC|nr:hypothetical protein BpHYR1_034125 [Brachionus plicatilis]
MIQNETSIKLYYSKRELSSIVADYINVFWLPLICIFGMITNILNILVSYNKNFLQNPLKVILVDSIGDLFFLLIQSFLFIIRCGSLCPWGYSYPAKFYEVYIYLLIGYILVVFRVLVDLSVSFNRLLILSSVQMKEINFYLQLIVFITIAIVLNVPIFGISRQIVVKGYYYPDRNSSSYEILYDKDVRENFKIRWVAIVMSAITVVKDPFLFTSFCGINIAIAVKFRQHMSKKKSMTLVNMVKTTVNTISQESTNKKGKSKGSSSRRENSTTLMLLGLCVIYFFGNLIDTSAIILDIFRFDVYYKYGFIVLIGNTLFFLSHSILLPNLNYFTLKHLNANQSLEVFVETLKSGGVVWSKIFFFIFKNKLINGKKIHAITLFNLNSILKHATNYFRRRPLFLGAKFEDVVGCTIV